MHYSQFLPSLLALGALLPSTVLSLGLRTEIFPSHCTDPCKGITFTNASYVCGDSRLGPVILPQKFPLRTELRTYSRFGDLCPSEFLSKWTTSLAPEGNYIYPPANGFVVDTDNLPIVGNTTLPAGQKLDRFGSEYGSFLAPLGAPYIERSLPPSNLITYDGQYPFNYHVYEVTRSFEVGLGPIAPWFGQPGMGTQIVVYQSVMALIEGGFLRRLEQWEYDEREEFADDYTPGPQGGDSVD